MSLEAVACRPRILEASCIEEKLQALVSLREKFAQLKPLEISAARAILLGMIGAYQKLNENEEFIGIDRERSDLFQQRFGTPSTSVFVRNTINENPARPDLWAAALDVVANYTVVTAEDGTRQLSIPEKPFYACSAEGSITVIDSSVDWRRGIVRSMGGIIRRVKRASASDRSGGGEKGYSGPRRFRGATSAVRGKTGPGYYWE